MKAPPLRERAFSFEGLYGDGFSSLLQALAMRERYPLVAAGGTGCWHPGFTPRNPVAKLAFIFYLCLQR